MTKIIYKQENPTAAPYIFPAAVALLGIGIVIYNYFALGGFTDAFVEKALIPGVLCFVFAGVVLLVMRSKIKKITGEFKEIRDKGQFVDGTVSEIVKHTYYSTDSNNHTYEKHRYSFLVTYADPTTGESVTAESIESDRNYTLIGPNCKAQVYDGKIVVDEAEVEVVPEQKKWPVIVVMAIIFIVLVYIFTR